VATRVFSLQIYKKIFELTTNHATFLYKNSKYLWILETVLPLKNVESKTTFLDGEKPGVANRDGSFPLRDFHPCRFQSQHENGDARLNISII